MIVIAVFVAILALYVYTVIYLCLWVAAALIDQWPLIGAVILASLAGAFGHILFGASWLVGASVGAGCLLFGPAHRRLRELRF